MKYKYHPYHFRVFKSIFISNFCHNLNPTNGAISLSIGRKSMASVKPVAELTVRVHFG